MKIIYINEKEETIHDIDISEEENFENKINEIKYLFDEKEIIDMKFSFAKGIKCGQTHTLENIKPEMVKQVTVKVKQ